MTTTTTETGFIRNKQAHVTITTVTNGVTTIETIIRPAGFSDVMRFLPEKQAIKNEAKEVRKSQTKTPMSLSTKAIWGTFGAMVLYLSGAGIYYTVTTDSGVSVSCNGNTSSCVRTTTNGDITTTEFTQY